MKKIQFTEEQIADIVTRYTQNFESMATIGKDYKVCKSTISRVLKENNVPLRKTNHTYKADYDKFEIIDSCEKAYWLGFLAADGCNYWRETNATILINIHQKDRVHLEKFKVFMDSNVPIKDFIQNCGFSNNTPMSKITFNSKKMSQDLSDKGIVPRKSLILKPPKIDEQYYLPFILGYFDGDGSIYCTSQNEFCINIVGTKEILEWINGILHISTSLEKRNDDEKNNYYIRCGGFQKPYKIMKMLYESSQVYLDRKYQIFKTLETVVLNRNIK